MYCLGCNRHSCTARPGASGESVVPHSKLPNSYIYIYKLLCMMCWRAAIMRCVLLRGWEIYCSRCKKAVVSSQSHWWQNAKSIVAPFSATRTHATEDPPHPRLATEHPALIWRGPEVRHLHPPFLSLPRHPTVVAHESVSKGCC